MDLFSLKHTASHRRHEIGRIQELFPAPCPLSLPEAFYTTMVTSGVMCE
jgi:hypothetical protein